MILMVVSASPRITAQDLDLGDSGHSEVCVVKPRCISDQSFDYI